MKFVTREEEDERETEGKDEQREYGTKCRFQS